MQCYAKQSRAIKYHSFSYDSNLFDAVLTIDDCTKVVKLLPNDKSPGPDEFTKN